MRLAFGAWLSPVERTVRVREVPSSNLGAPTVLLPPPSIADGGSLNPAMPLRRAVPNCADPGSWLTSPMPRMRPRGPDLGLPLDVDS